MRTKYKDRMEFYCLQFPFLVFQHNAELKFLPEVKRLNTQMTVDMHVSFLLWYPVEQCKTGQRMGSSYVLGNFTF